MQKIKFRILAALLRLFAALPWPLLHALGRLLGYVFWRFKTREFLITRANIRHCLPELDAEAQARLVRESLVEFGKTALEMPKMWLSDPSVVLARIAEIDGEELLRRELQLGRGAILLVPHHGNWEVAGLYFGRYGMTSMYLPSQGEAVDELVRSGRSRSGATLVPADTSGVRSLLKALRSGGLVGVLPDQVPKQGGELAPFFGEPALTMTLIGNLLRKTDARAVICAALRRPDGRFRLVVRAPDPAIYSQDPAEALLGLNRSVETAVRDSPAQYQWEYKRFKGQPRGVPSIYD